MKRFYAFGCSFTQYNWPTWADLIGSEFDEYENWGSSGSGNHLIFNRVIECHQRNQFTEDDTVVVQWTNYFREDRWLDLTKANWHPKPWGDRTGWMNPGNLATQSLYDNDFVMKYGIGHEKGFLIRDLAYITAIRHLLANTKCKWQFISMVPLINQDQYHQSTTRFDDVELLYKDTLDLISPSFLEAIFANDWDSRRPVAKIEDRHPLPLEHLEYVGKIMPDFVISQAVKDYAAQVQQEFVERSLTENVSLITNIRNTLVKYPKNLL